MRVINLFRESVNDWVYVVVIENYHARENKPKVGDSGELFEETKNSRKWITRILGIS